MKKKAKLISVLSAFGVLTIAGVSVGCILSLKNDKNTKHLPNNSLSNQKIANVLSNYINNTIQIHSLLTANEALLRNNVNQTKFLILQSVQNDLRNNNFNLDNNLYSVNDIIDNLKNEKLWRFLSILQ